MVKRINKVLSKFRTFFFKKMKVSIQGIKGSYHHQVALELLGNDIEINECLSFDNLAESLKSNQVDFAVMAIENSIAGSIIPNYALIDNYSLTIVDEYYIEIKHQLMALPGSKLNDIKEVASHPMALLQCKKFFKLHPNIKLIEESDTAAVAKRISDDKIKSLGAIASYECSKIYKLDIVSKNIHSISNNSTRFVLLEKTSSNKSKLSYNKASIKFVLNHKTGNLAAILNIISENKLNLTKIQSLPMAHTPWKYSFFVDITFENQKFFEKTSKIIKNVSESFKILGTYNNKLRNDTSK